MCCNCYSSLGTIYLKFWSDLSSASVALCRPSNHFHRDAHNTSCSWSKGQMSSSPFQLENCDSHAREMMFIAKNHVQANVLGRGNNLDSLAPGEERLHVKLTHV